MYNYVRNIFKRVVIVGLTLFIPLQGVGASAVLDNSALAPPLASKPLASIQETVSGLLEIREDKDFLAKVLQGFRKDAERIYFNILKKQAEVPDDVLKLLIKEHVEKLLYVWKPTIMCLEITQQCDNPKPCRLCASRSTMKCKALLTKDEALNRLREAKVAGIKNFSITGGEPTLEEETLFSLVEEGERIGVKFNYLNTNCYNWGESVELARNKLRRIARIKGDNWKKDNVRLCISVGDEHARGIPVERVANFIEAYQEVFPDTVLEAIALRQTASDNALEKLISILRQRHILENTDEVVSRDSMGRVNELKLKQSRLSIFYNYAVPIGRHPSDMEDFEHYYMPDKYLNRPISQIETAVGSSQVIIIGWDNKASPDIVFKCTDTIVIPDSDIKTIDQIIAEGNRDPLLRAGVQSVWRILEAAKQCGYSKLIETLRKKHSTIHGLIAELISDADRKEAITLSLAANDQEPRLEGVDKPIDGDNGLLEESQWGKKLLNVARARAYEAKKQNIIIGIESSFIPKSQRDDLQGILAELKRLRNEEGLDNIIIEYGEGEQLVGFINKEAEKRKTPNSNIIFLGKESVLDSEIFDSFRESTKPEEWAFFAGIEFPDNSETLPENTYIRLLEMLTKSVNLWAGKTVELDTPYLRIVQEGKRSYKFIFPEIIEYDPQILRDIYSGQLRAMKSA
jgi:molybdenum cofactor biosynthesis enzyme MoaA